MGMARGVEALEIPSKGLLIYYLETEYITAKISIYMLPTFVHRTRFSLTAP